MKTIGKFLSHIFIDGLSGMGLGLFSTLIIGTIMKQIGDLIGGDIGMYICDIICSCGRYDRCLCKCHFCGNASDRKRSIGFIRTGRASRSIYCSLYRKEEWLVLSTAEYILFLYLWWLNVQ